MTEQNDSKGVIAQGGAVKRSIEEHFGDFLSVQDFGQVGRDAKQDQDVLNSADAALHTLGRRTLRVAEGSNLVSPEPCGLEKADHTILRGDGRIFGSIRKAIHSESLGGPVMFPQTVKARHLRQFHNACRTGKATVVVMGDSIFATASDMISHTENATFAWIETLQQHNPGVEFHFVNAAVGGRNWHDMNDPACKPPPWIDPVPESSWKEAVAALKPDLLLLNSGGNDVGCFSVQAVHELIGFFQSQPHVPSIVLGISHPPSLSSDLNDYGTETYIQGMDGVTKWLRTYAIRHGIGYLDFYRWHLMRRDGFDPTELALTQVCLDDSSSIKKFGMSTGNPNLSRWVFPNVMNPEGVSASACTDYAVSFELTSRPLFLSIDLSGQPVDGHCTKCANRLYIWLDEEDGMLAYSWSDGAQDDNANKRKTSIPIPAFPAKFVAMVKGSRVVFGVWCPFRHSDWQPDGLVHLGTGYRYVCDDSLVRFGGEFTPSIQWAGSSDITVYNLCVGSSVVCEAGGARNSPDFTNYELYAASVHAGGSGHYHMNAYGVRDILVPVLRAQAWDVPVCEASSELSLELVKMRQDYDAKIESIIKAFHDYIRLGSNNV